LKHKLLSYEEFGRSYAVVFDVDDDVLDELQRFCENEHVYAARLSGIGGLRRARLGFYDLDKKQYEPIPIEEQVEVLSLLGNVTKYQNTPKVHAHCVVGHRDGRTTGGHLLGGTVRPTLELMVDEVASPLHRADRPEIGIPLIEL
jgi:predicted DNA-binding protein with PD1-like motif